MDEKTKTEYKIVPLTDVIPELKKIQTVSELLLVDALNTVGQAFYNLKIDVRGVRILNDVVKTLAYAHVLNKPEETRFIYGVSDVPPEETYKDMNERTGKYLSVDFLDRALNLKFETHEPGVWYFTKVPIYAENSMVTNGYYSQGYLQAIAHVYLHRYTTGENIRLVVSEFCQAPEYEGFCASPAMRHDNEYAHMLLLKDTGSKLFTPEKGFELVYKAESGKSQDWAAYCTGFLMRGLQCKNYDAKVKYKYFKSKFNVGDVVLIYGRTAKVKKNNAASFKYINTCYPAVIVDVTPEKLTFTKYICLKTRLTALKEFQEIKLRGGGELYTGDEIFAFPAQSRTVRWEEIGIEGYTYKEGEIIVTPMEDDGTTQYIAADGTTKKDVEPVFLNTIETIYAIFEDRGVSYDKEAFLLKYFKGKTPIYDQIKAGKYTGK